MNSLTIFESDLTGGTCGFPATIPGQDPADVIRNELIRRNRIVKNLGVEFDLEIDRIFLKNIGFLGNEKVKGFVFQKGISALPVFLLNNDRIIHHGSFPDLDELSAIIKKELLMLG